MAFSPDGKTVLTGTLDGMAQSWTVPTPLAADTDRIMLWAKVVTGMELDEWGGLRSLDDQAWLQSVESCFVSADPRNEGSGSIEHSQTA